MEKVSENLLLFRRNLQANGAQFFWDTLYVMTPWSKEINDFSESHLQVHPSLYLAFAISFFAVVCNRCNWDSLVLERVLQAMLP